MTDVLIEHPPLGETDGFRGPATDERGSGRMNAETIAGIAYTVVERELEQGNRGPVVVAQDTRASGKLLREAVIAAAASQRGIDVIDLGVHTTPGTQWAGKQLGALATFVVSASHNKASDNGLKYMPGHNKPSRDVVRDISDRYWQRADSGITVPDTILASNHPEVRSDLKEQYVESVVAEITRQFGEAPLSGKLFVIDGANGASMGITPRVFEMLGARVERFACDGAGLINKDCGAADLKKGLMPFLLSRPDITSDPEFVGALANDGDGDRIMGVAMVNGEPQEITGNHIMEALALYPKQPGIVGTDYTNTAAVRRLLEAGVGFEYCKNGDLNVTNALLAKQAAGEPWTRGGEFTGHAINTLILPSGDGTYMGAWFAAMAVKRGMNFGGIWREMPMWPELKLGVNLPELGKYNFDEDPAVLEAVAGAMAEFGNDGRVIARSSGTEKGLFRVWAEGTDRNQVEDIAARLAKAVGHIAAQVAGSAA